MNKVFVLVLIFMSTFGLYGADELEHELLAKEEGIDDLVKRNFSGQGLQEDQIEEIKQILLHLPDHKYIQIVGQFALRRSLSASQDDSDPKLIIQALAQISSHLEKQNEIMKRQLAEDRRANAAREEEGDDREFDHEERRAARMFEQYKWKVGVATGMLTTLVATIVATWQGDVATQCMSNTTT